MPGPTWSRAEEDLLRRLTAAGKTPIQIVDESLLPGRNLHSIAKKKGRMKLADPRRSFRTSEGRRHRLKGRRKQRFVEFLQNEGRDLPAAEIARRWKLSARTVREYRALHAPAEHGDAALESTRVRQSESAYRRHERRRFEEEVARRTKQLRMEKEGCELPKRKCKRCGEEFFATREFFEPRTYSRKGVVRLSLSRRCRTCDAEARTERWKRYPRRRARRKNSAEGAAPREQRSGPRAG